MFFNCLEKIKNAICESQKINQVWNILKKSLKNAVEQYIPTKTIRLNRANERVWLNKTSRKLDKHQRNAYHKYKQSEIIHHFQFF